MVDFDDAEAVANMQTGYSSGDSTSSQHHRVLRDGGDDGDGVGKTCS